METSKLTETEKGEEQSQCISFSLISTGLFKQNSIWQAKQSILHTTVMFYCDCMAICKDFALKFGDKGTGRCFTTTHSLILPFSPGNLTKNMTVIPH
jgi:hypothetical protein